METTATWATATGFAAMVERAYTTQLGLYWNDGSVESAFRAQFATMSARNHTWKRETFRRLLLHLYAQGCYALLRNPHYVGILAAMSAFGNKMVREPEEWQKASFVAEEQLAALIRHCFALYEVPAFMESVFASGNKIHMLWYIQLGRGDSVQSLCGFPVKFTRQMAHEFRRTPGTVYTVAQAIRRAQALGYGATGLRAEAIAWSSLSESFEDEDFRATVIQFIAGVQEEVDFLALQQVLEYLAAMRREQEGYSMRGRTWPALVRQSAEWQREMAKRRDAENYLEWNNGMLSCYRIERESATFMMVQLTNSEALYEEGYEMSHCVADYGYNCAEGTIAIFSLRKYGKEQEGFERLATVEVQLETLEIVQAKAEYNAWITEEANTVLTEWAAIAGLTVGFDYEDGFYEPAPQPGMQQVRKAPEIAWIWGLALLMVIFLMRACDASQPDPEYRLEKMPDGTFSIEQVNM